jgi:hypothetical protein
MTVIASKIIEGGDVEIDEAGRAVWSGRIQSAPT